MPGIASLGALFAASATTAGLGQLLAGSIAATRFAANAKSAPLPAALPAITVLKPLHGDEPLLEAALESFFRQDYPSFQLVFGVQRQDDTAIAVVERLIARHPQIPASLIIDATAHGANRKIGNLINMLPAAAFETLVISDSDMHVAPDYLARVAEALARPNAGLVTTLYTGLPAQAGITPALGAAYINQIFAAGALMARGLGRQDCMGATMALHRSTLASVGGLEALSDFVADDGILGRKVAALGKRVELAATIPATTVGETRLGALLRHELRWARTIRAMEPVGFAASCVQYPSFWAVLTVILAHCAGWSLALLALTLAARAGLGRRTEAALGAAAAPLWLAPVRDLLSFGILAAAFLDDRVQWRGHIMTTAPDRLATAHQTSAREGNFISPPPLMAHGEG